MKILQINSVLSYGSTGGIVRDIYDVLTSNGNECLIAFGRGNYVEGYNAVKFSSKFETYFHFMGSRIFDNHGLMSEISTKKLISIIKNYKPDLIQLHNIHGYYLNYKLLFNYLSETNIPVVWLMHDQWALSGGSAYLDNPSENKSCRNRKERKSYPKIYLKDRYKLNLNIKKEVFTKLNNLTIITPSDWLSNQFKESYFAKYNIITINNGIDLKFFKPFVTHTNKTNKVILGIASVWDSRKGANYFFDLSRDLSNDVKIKMVGINKEIENYVKNNNLSIELITRTNSREELVKLYSEADILINPTLQDNFPTVNIESQACGTPVISFQTGGSPESIIPYKTGLVIEKGNYEKLLSAIKDWPDKNSEIVNNCVENAKNYDKNIIYNNYIELYKKIIEDKNEF